MIIHLLAKGTIRYRSIDDMNAEIGKRQELSPIADNDGTRRDDCRRKDRRLVVATGEDFGDRVVAVDDGQISADDVAQTTRNDAAEL